MRRGKHIVFLLEVLEQLGGSVACVGAHKRGALLERGIQLGEVAIHTLKSLVKKSVLHHHELDVVLSAGTAELGSALCIESGGLHEVEAAVLFEGIGDFADDDCFIFLFHCRCLFVDYSSMDLESTLMPGPIVLER